MPFSARQNKKTAVSAYPNWPTQADRAQFFGETIQYAGSTSGSANGSISPQWQTYTVANIDREHTALIRHPNGNIYGFSGNTASGSNNTGNILIYNPSAGAPSVTTVTTSTPALKTVMSSDTFCGGALGGNGNIYLAPGAGRKGRLISGDSSTSNKILEYDAVNDTHRTISTGLTGSNLFAGAFTDKTGNVFLTPWDHPGGFTKIDCSVEPATITNNITFGYSKIASDKKFIGGTAHPNGKCYLYPAKQTAGVPGNASTNIHLLEIDPISQTSTEINTNNFCQSNTDIVINATLLGPDGCIYGLPETTNIGTSYSSDLSKRILKFDPRTSTTTKVTGYDRETSSGMIAPNGIMYIMPQPATDNTEFHNVQTNTNTLYTNSGTNWEFTDGNPMACDTANVYVGGDTSGRFGIIPFNQSGGSNANAYTLSVYVQNTN